MGTRVLLTAELDLECGVPSKRVPDTDDVRLWLPASLAEQHMPALEAQGCDMPSRSGQEREGSH